MTKIGQYVRERDKGGCYIIVRANPNIILLLSQDKLPDQSHNQYIKRQESKTLKLLWFFSSSHPLVILGLKPVYNSFFFSFKSLSRCSIFFFNKERQCLTSIHFSILLFSLLLGFPFFLYIVHPGFSIFFCSQKNIKKLYQVTIIIHCFNSQYITFHMVK